MSDNTPFVIETNVPVPPIGGGRNTKGKPVRDTLNLLEVGNSVLIHHLYIERTVLWHMIKHWKKLNPSKTLVTAQEINGTRIWRTS